MTGKKINTKININKDDSSLNDFLSLWSEFGVRPNKVFIHGDFSEEILEILKKYQTANNFREIAFQADSDVINDKTLIKISDTIFVSLVVVDREVDTQIQDLVIYYKSEDDLKNVEELVDIFKENLLIQDEIRLGNFHIASLSQSGLEVKNIPQKNIREDIEDLYSKKTWKSTNKIIKRLRKGETGLVIFWGERGCGKSNFIDYLTSVVDRDVIFLPNTMTDLATNSPDFRKILTKFHKPIVVIDDCEIVFSEFFTKSNLMCNNLIQLVDSVVPVEELTVITLFNSKDEDDIDHNLLESNALIDLVEFTRLDKEEANELAKTLKIKSKFTGETKLVDVFKANYFETKEKVGF
jgi:hypothetical protein